jgi:acyl carrier protein
MEVSLRENIRELVGALAPVPDSDEAPLELSSLDLVTLAETLEGHFSFRVFAKDLSEENFGSVRSLCDFVQRSRGHAG